MTNNLPIPAGQHLAHTTTTTLRQDLMKADERRAELFRAGDWETLAWVVNEARKIKFELDTFVRECEENVAALMPNKKEAVDGLGVIERRTTSSRKWESPELMRKLVRDILDPDRTGEVKVEQVMKLISTLEQVLPLTPSLGWRVTPLKENGVNIDAYSEVTYGRSNITITN
jgi:hypothetical protein